MKTTKTRLTIDDTAQHLREIVRRNPPGTALGNEDELIKVLGASRATVRQTARLLEREGLLEVRRGLHGGYYSARPNLRTIEDSVSSYLEMLDTDVKETTVIGSVLWVEVLRTAARSRTEKDIEPLKNLHDKISLLRPTQTFDDALHLEQELRSAIFTLSNSRFIELIFHINLIFSRRKFPTNPSTLDGTGEHQEFIKAWRATKLMELESIIMGDQELAAMAGRHSRNLWYKRIWGEDAI